MYDPCDNCNRPICHGCPHQEEEKTFAENLEIGWDYAIEQLAKETTDDTLLDLISIYWQGYDYQENADPDDGECYEIRSYAIRKILEVLQ